MTPKMKQLYEYIKTYIQANGGISPSYDDMQKALSLKSKSGIVRLIDALVAYGYVERMPHRARAIVLKEKQSLVERLALEYIKTKGLQKEFDYYVRRETGRAITQVREVA